MREEKTLSKFTVLIILLTIVALILVSGTYARYTTSINASDVATVAKWSILVEGEEMAVTGTQPTVAFNLFETINEEDGTTAEDDVAADRIAPGTGGAFALDIENASEVNAQYTLEFDVTNDSNIPLQFSTDGGTTWGTLDGVTTPTAIAMSDGAENGDDEVTVNIQWRWAYGDDAANQLSDTAIGIAARTASTVTVEATIDVTQVN